MSKQSVQLRDLLEEKKRRSPQRPFSSLEELLTAPDLFGLVTATPVQRALCRVIDAVPLGGLANHPDVAEVFGCDPHTIPVCRPKEFAVLSGIRSGKTLFAAAVMVYASQTVDTSKLGPGEIPRISLVSFNSDLALVIFQHITGRLEASPRLATLMVEKPQKDSCIIRHPSGTKIEIAVIANSRAGGSLVSRWSAGCVFDEFPRLNGESDGVVNWNDARRAVLERVLPGGTILSIGSPWAPRGPAYDMANDCFGKPTPQLILAWGPAPLFNPVTWTAEKIADAAMNPDTYITECLGKFANPEESLLTGVELESCTRKQPVFLPYNSRNSYRAAMDPATRGNGWTFVIATREGNLKKLVYAFEWRGSKMVPLNPREVLYEIADICEQYNITTIETDRYMADTLKELARERSLFIRQVNMGEAETAKKYMTLKVKMALGEIELVPDRTLRSDLLGLKKRATPKGVKIILPATADGRHCDYAPSIILALGQYLDDSTIASALTPDQQMAKNLREQHFKEVANKRRNPRQWGYKPI